MTPLLAILLLAADPAPTPRQIADARRARGDAVVDIRRDAGALADAGGPAMARNRRAIQAAIDSFDPALVGKVRSTIESERTSASGALRKTLDDYTRLFAAIPAVVSYNRFAREIDKIAIALETYIEEFSNILQRNLSANVNPASAAVSATAGR